MTAEVVVGRPPTPSEAATLTAATTLTLDKALDRVDATARLVLSTLALVGVVLTGFGLVSDVSTRLRANTDLYLLPLGLAVLAAVLALLALVPWFSRANPANLTAVDRFLRKLVLVRGVLVTAAMAVLLLAVVLAGKTALFDASRLSLSPTMSVSRAQTAEGETLNVTAKMSGAPDGSVARLRLGEDGEILSSQRVGASGAVDMSVTVDSPAAETEVVFTLTEGDETVTTARLGLVEP